MIHRFGLGVLVAAALCAATLEVRAATSPSTETPIWANDFVDSIGENTHCTFARIGWVDCRNPDGAKAAIETLGVRHIRDGVSDYWYGYGDSGKLHIPTYAFNGVSTPVTVFYNRLAADAGVKFDFVIGLTYGNHSPYVRDVVAAVPSTESLELGGNEPDNPSYPDPCPSPNPDRLSCWPKDVVNQIHYYSSYMKAAGLKRIGPSILFGPQYTCSNLVGSQTVVLPAAECPKNGAPNLAVTQNLTAYLDANNLHYYAGEKHPGNGDVVAYRSNAKVLTTPDLDDTWMTEAGYGTGKNGNTDLAIAKYEPRMFAENFYEGVERTYQFEMFDQAKAAGGPYFDTFGLLSVDFENLTFTPKLQYESLRSLIQIMNDPGTKPTLVPVSYTIAGGDSKLHHILAQRRDGTYQLLMWVEGRDPTPPQTVTLSFCAPQLTVGTLSLFTPSNGQYVNSQLSSKLNGRCAQFGPLHVSDTMEIFRFGKKPFAPAKPMPLATPFVMVNTAAK